MLTSMSYFDYKAQVRVPGASIRLTRFALDRPTDASFRQDEGYWLDCSLTPRTRNARGCFPNERAGRHYEPIGSVFVVPPGEEFLARSDEGEQLSLLCVLDEQQLSAWFERDFLWTRRHFGASVDVQAPGIIQLLRRLGDELRRPGIASEVLCEAIAVQLGVELCRYYGAVSERSTPGGLTGWRLRLVEERVRDADHPPTLTELATVCGLSVRQLTRGFRATRGRSLGDYIAEARIERAKRMICMGNRIKEVAFALGFASPSSFCYAFRRATGQSPRQFGVFAGTA